MSDDDFSELPLVLQEELIELRSKVRMPAVARVLWDRLTENERTSLENDLTTYCDQFEGAIGIWMHLKQVSVLQAVIEVAHETDLITVSKLESLRRNLPDQVEQRQSLVQPSWDASTGELWYREKLARRVRHMNPPTNIERVLDCFQSEEWSRCVTMPDAWDQPTAHQTINSLNKGLIAIRFRVRDSGHTACWEVQNDLQVISKSTRIE